MPPIPIEEVFTHFVVLGERLCRGFKVEQCERCGCDVEAVNGFKVLETREKLLGLGLVELPRHLPELLLAEHLGGICVCPDCFDTKLPDDEPVTVCSCGAWESQAPHAAGCPAAVPDLGGEALEARLLQALAETREEVEREGLNPWVITPKVQQLAALLGEVLEIARGAGALKT